VLLLFYGKTHFICIALILSSDIVTIAVLLSELTMKKNIEIA